MKKIDVSHILVDHIRTLCDSDTKKISKADLCLFYALPLLLSFAPSHFDYNFDRDTIGTSISVFAIFSALLLSVQIALFSVLQREWESPTDENAKSSQEDRMVTKSALIEELNTNVSYLIILCLISVSIFFCFYAVKLPIKFETAITVFFYVHFLLTTIMVVKRAHAVFGREYKEK